MCEGVIHGPKYKNIVAGLILFPVVMFAPLTAIALEVNKSNLWFGGDDGIEIIFRTGKNLAYTWFTMRGPPVSPQRLVSPCICEGDDRALTTL